MLFQQFSRHRYLLLYFGKHLGKDVDLIFRSFPLQLFLSILIISNILHLVERGIEVVAISHQDQLPLN